MATTVYKVIPIDSESFCAGYTQKNERPPRRLKRKHHTHIYIICVCVHRIVEAALCVCYEADVCFLVALLCYVAPRLGTSALGNHRSRTLRVGVG